MVHRLGRIVSSEFRPRFNSAEENSPNHRRFRQNSYRQLLRVQTVIYFDYNQHSYNSELATPTNQTRNSNTYNLPVHHSKLFEETPSYAGVNFYSDLPADLKTFGPTLLKSKLKLWLAARFLYNIAEFFFRRDQDF